MILSMTSILNFMTYNVDTTSEAIGTLASFGYMILLGIIVLTLSIFTISYWWELRKSKRKSFANLNSSDDSVRKETLKGFVFYLNFRTSNAMYYSYPMVFIIRRVLVACILVLWKHDGFYQLV